jgi:hypothetical protein
VSAADAVAMDKVRECGLMLSRDGARQGRNIFGGEPCVAGSHRFWAVAVEG